MVLYLLWSLLVSYHRAENIIFGRFEIASRIRFYLAKIIINEYYGNGRIIFYERLWHVTVAAIHFSSDFQTDPYHNGIINNN